MSENLFQENSQIDPKELQEILIGFLGNTYGEISKFDNNIISSNPTLSHKKYEFERLAEKVLQEATPNSRVSAPAQQQISQVHYHPVGPQIRGNPIEPQQYIDPNQLEFSFDNSITATTINKKLEDIESKIKKLDKSIETLISLLENHEIKNKQQN